MTSAESGLVQVYTGDGKGKTTAAVGLAVRAVGVGMTVAFVQFVKGGSRSGELAVLEELGVRVERPAVHSTGLLGGGLTDDDREAAREAWEIAAGILSTAEYDVVVLDEINVAMRYELVAEADVLATLDARLPGVEVVLTGRGASEALIARADLVTEMVARKHPFEAGVPARRGIEY
ncbi:MAG: cob(I)yrinic acid a,c-diamide adenosyltransferase [Coriobacteriia bacterium]|nr:cob(I)yrinic acid a,c-diamide adenosyltransferase [Coriobacteriia bacterium]